MSNLFFKKAFPYSIPSHKITFNAEKSNNLNESLVQKGIPIRKQQCYENVFRSFNFTQFDILYSFVELQNLSDGDTKVYFRHCMFINEQHEAICPTLPLVQKMTVEEQSLDIIPIAHITRDDYMNSFTDSADNGDGTFCYSKMFSHENSIIRQLYLLNKFILS